jgi:hypothetical protein
MYAAVYITTQLSRCITSCAAVTKCVGNSICLLILCNFLSVTHILMLIPMSSSWSFSLSLVLHAFGQLHYCSAGSETTASEQKCIISEK